MPSLSFPASVAFVSENNKAAFPHPTLLKDPTTDGYAVGL